MSEAVPAAPHVAPAPFTPSELVTFFGERFAGEGGMLTAKEEVLGSGRKVSSEELARAAILAAILEAERAGAVRLETRATSKLFGLVKGEKLHLIPGGAAAAWPRGSLEQAVADAAAREPTVEEAVAAIVAKESYNPSQELLAIVKAGMTARGLLEVEEKKTLVVFSSARFIVPEDTRLAAGHADVAAVERMLREAEQGRPAIWQALVKNVRAGIVWMTASHD